MIHVVLGDKGSGKTKRMIDMANQAAANDEQVIYVDDDNRYMYDLRHEIRFADASEYGEPKSFSADWLYGLLCGMLSANFDLSAIYIDAFKKFVNCDLNELEPFFARLTALSEKRNVRFVLSISGEVDSIPAFIRAHAV